jgi:DNA (cytosine-5)-methyltransferase 1
MKAYYNEIDRFCCDWISNLMDAGQITLGKIDDRSIVDVRPDDLAGFERVHFFAGIGGWDLALTIAGWSQPVWTGSCPCQPFSLAGKQKGFEDDRHLWPVFRDLIRLGRPATVFGEQVASASDWLRLVRGDLEALEYAVGAMPIEAASAGADHLRDRYWFVANTDDARSQGRSLLPERACERPTGPDGLANTESQRGREVLGHVKSSAGRGQSPGHSSSGGQDGMDVADPGSDGAGRGPEGRSGSEGATERQHWRASRSSLAPRLDGEVEWVIGADGKARRVKPGIRLLAHGVPNRVGLLRGFGNAIDPRPAAAFIRAAKMTITSTERQDG